MRTNARLRWHHMKLDYVSHPRGIKEKNRFHGAGRDNRVHIEIRIMLIHILCVPAPLLEN